MGRLFIIGNGFDLYYGLPTKTDNFIEELEKIKFRSFVSVYEAYQYYGVDWSTFEESLSEIDLNLIEEETESYPDYLSDSEDDREVVIRLVKNYTAELYDARNTALRNMITKAEEKLEKIKNNSNPGVFKNDDDILSFNYTSTVESLFDYKKEVFHIHGSYSKEEELIFGFKDESQEYYSYKSKLDSEQNIKLNKEKQEIKNNNNLSIEVKISMIEDIEYNYEQNWNDPYVDKEHEAIISFYESNKKIFQYDKLKHYLKGLNNIDEVVVLGHSMQDVDREYFNIIEENLSPQRWIVSARNEEEINKRQSICSSYPFANKYTIKLMTDILCLFFYDFHWHLTIYI